MEGGSDEDLYDNNGCKIRYEAYRSSIKAVCEFACADSIPRKQEIKNPEQRVLMQNM